MCDPFILSFGVGIAQVLNSFSKISLDAQTLWKFPGTLAISLQTLCEELCAKFQWSAKPLSLALGIGTPSEQIENIKKGKFVQKLTSGMKRSAAVNPNLYKQDDHIRESGRDFTSKDTEEQEIGVEALSPEQLTEVEHKLDILTDEIVKELNLRIVVSPIVKASVVAFHDTVWYDKAVDSNEQKQRAKEKLSILIDSLVPINFNVDSLLPGYLSFLDYKTTLIENPDLSLEEIYRDFYKRNENKNTDFLSLFEFVNIKSYSEAYCESVGSLMNILVNKGRNLAPGNFSRELIIAFNSPPLHILSQHFIPEVAECLIKERAKDFCRTLDFSQKSYMLKFRILSASLGNFRDNAEKNTHLPLSFFKNNTNST